MIGKGNPLATDLGLFFLSGPDVLTRVIADSSDHLKFDCDYRIFGQLIDMSCRHNDDNGIPMEPTIKPHPIPSQMWLSVYDKGRCLKQTREDRYGNKLTFVYVKQLRKLKIPENTSLKNVAIKAFVDALPDDVPVVLMWH